MGIFGSSNSPTRINQVRINQSVMGYALPAIMGKGKVQQSLLWMDGFSWSKISGSTNGSGGKGFGGGKGGSEFDYSADVLAALCNGSVVGIGDVWSGQSWLSNNSAAETWTITGGTPVYTPTNAANLALDNGVSVASSVSGSYSDLGSTAPTVISGTTSASLTAVTYASGATLAAGTYSVNPTTGQYNFSASDDGQTVTMYYDYTLDYIKQQQIDLIPSGCTVNIGTSGGGSSSTPTYYADGGVMYYASDGTSNPLNGTALTRVSGTPTATGTYSVSGSNPTVYHFASGDIGQEIQITYQLNNSQTLLTGVPSSLGFLLFAGEPGQTPWSLLTSSYPGAALGYTSVAYVAYAPMDLGTDAQIGQNNFEVFTADAWGGSIVDCNPIQCIGQVLTNSVWGLGVGSIPFPASCIDNGTGGTWGAAKGSSGVITDGTASSWCAANGYYISPVIDKQETAASCMSKWLEAGQLAAYMSEGLLKLVAYGDTTTSGNGVVWTAPSTFAASLDDTNFVVKGDNEDPVKIAEPVDYLSAWNTVQVSWSNRSNQYASEITPESDQAAINRYGARIEDPQSWDFITTLPAATFAASMRVKRNVYIRNTYEFALSYQYSYLEPMDVVYLTTSSTWAQGLNNLNLNVTGLPVRITKVVDNPDGTIDITAEDYPFGANQPVINTKGVANPVVPTNNPYADPGETTVVIMDAPLELKTYSGNELWIGATGAANTWGGCYVYASLDGTTYQQIGTIKSKARLGTLASTFPAGSDPDTINSLVVNLSAGSSALESATAANADADTTLCYVDGELLSYSACTVTGIDQYTATTHTRRGQMGTSIGSHAIGASFLRLDDTVFQYSYAASWVGKTVSLKFQSFNNAGSAPQELSDCQVYLYTPAGTTYPAPPVVTITQSATNTSGSGSTQVATAGVSASGSSLTTQAAVWLTISWTWPTNFPTPTGFNVTAFTGSDPTNTTNYLFPLTTVGASSRTYIVAVIPTASMTIVNAAVEACY